MKPILRPIVKYQGGKSRELPLIQQLLPSQFRRVVEPFCGGAAVSFGLGYPALMGDINRDVIDLYSVVANEDLYSQLQLKVDYLKCLEHDDLEKEYYAARETINRGRECVSQYERALSYILVRQLCFSGMERYNSKGEFNVPFGHYKTFSCSLSPNHHKYLNKKCNFIHGSFVSLFEEVGSEDFVFVDPPYLERLGYSQGDGGLSLHEDLLGCLKETKSKWMVVHSDHDFYRENYKDFNIFERDFGYSQRFGKGKNHSNAKVKHLYITNYTK